VSAQEQAAAARAGAALFRRDTAGLLAVTGGDRVRWLDGMLSNDITALEPAPGRSGCPALLLTRAGRIVADPHVLLQPDAFWLDVARDALPAVQEALDRYIVADDVALQDVSDATQRFALEGPAASQVLEAACGEPPALVKDGIAPCEIAGIAFQVAAYGFTSGALQLFVPAGAGDTVRAALLEAGAPHGLREASAEAHEILRIEAGVPQLGTELDDSVLPAEAGLERAISFTKGCYTGQEIVARLASQGSPAHRLVGLRFASGAVPEPGAPISNADKRVGELTSFCESPAAGAIGLGFVRSAAAEPETTLLVGDREARIAALPFVA